MAADRQGELGWTPPRAPAVSRQLSGSSPGSSRGKLRSEYQARLGGMTVKKRRSGALKFSATTTDSRPAAAATATPAVTSAASGRTPPPPPPPRRGSRQTSLLDFCHDTSVVQRQPAEAGGEAAAGFGLLVPPGAGVASTAAAATAAMPLPQQQQQQQQQQPQQQQPADSSSTAMDMDTSEDDFEADSSTRPQQQQQQQQQQQPTSTGSSSSSAGHTPSPAPAPAATATPPTGFPPPPAQSPADSFGLLGGGAAAALSSRNGGGASPAGAGGGGGSEIGGGGGGSSGSSGSGHQSQAIYSDRFIPARFGSVLETGSPFLAGGGSHSTAAGRGGHATNGNGSGGNSSTTTTSPSPGGGGGGGGQRGGGTSQARARGGGGRAGYRSGFSPRGLIFSAGGPAGGGGGGGGGGGSRRRLDAADPGGIRGTEGGGGVAGRQGRPGGAQGAHGAGQQAGGGGSAAVPGVGSPEYWPYGSSATDAQREGQTMLNMLLRSELLGTESPGGRGLEQAGAAEVAAATAAGRRGGRLGGTAGMGGGGGGDDGGTSGGALTPSPNVFRFKVPRQAYEEDVKMSYSISPVSQSTKMLSKPGKAKRKIPKIPFKVLDAPQLQDDFYLNLVDWSSLNVLAVGLGACVYLWSACTSKVTKLCDLGRDVVSSVAWTQRGTHLAVGTNTGLVQIWDTGNCKKIRTMTGHSNRVGTMSWNAHSLASGSRDRLILMRDVRAAEPFTQKLVGHKQEVCGLKWSFDDKQLASGGNDNKLLIWNAHSTSPVLRFGEHTAAVKAIAWSPHQHGILASGGGTADRCIRFWNSQTSARLSCVDTGSQVCNLMWSKNINEIVSTHGYSLNQIIVWRYPSMTKVTTLTGHTMRVLYLAMSPDGQTIVTGAGDETLRFWNAFPGPKSREGSGSAGLLFPAGVGIR